MLPDRQHQIEALYHDALAHPPEARAAFLAEECANDEPLRREVESLLGYAASDSFLPQLAIVSPPRLTSGQTLGHYVIVAPLGKGGMGEVYRARDTRLPREVAIKVLPAHVASDPDRRKRLEREAHAVSALNHQHICTLHDVGHEDGLDFLVLELVEGGSLSDRLSKGPLPLAEAITIAVEIAEGLSAAHRRGIVHRDLKPGNVMLSKGGAKLLDFGLARFVAPTSAAAPVGPTDTSLTERGAIIGTVQYMAPEQVEGREADARSDIFAFGAVLYEMVTGRKAFEAANDAGLISAILRDQPEPMSVRQPLTPPALDRIVRTCLEKDPDNRWQSAADLARELRWVADDVDRAQSSGTAAPRSAPSRADVGHPRRAAWLGVGLAAGAALTALGLWAVRVPPAGPRTVRHLQVGLAPAEALRGFRPDELTVGAGRPSTRVLALSPDGRTLVFGGVRDGVQQLFRRDLDRDEAIPIPATQEATQPFFSPDGRRLGFWQPVREGKGEGRLRWVPIEGGAAVDICKVTLVVGSAWAEDGAVVFGGTDGLKRVPPAGGEAEEFALAHGKPAQNPAGRRAFLYPQLLPGARGGPVHVSPDAQNVRHGRRDAVT